MPLAENLTRVLEGEVERLHPHLPCAEVSLLKKHMQFGLAWEARTESRKLGCNCMKTNELNTGETRNVPSKNE